MARKKAKKSDRTTTCEKSNKLFDSCEKFHDISVPCEINHICPPNCENSLIRLNRAIAETGLCSRRKADDLILSGQIEVNGTTISDPATRVSRTDRLSRLGSPLSSKQAKVTYLLNKPVQVVCTASDPQGRKTVLDLLPPEMRKLRLYPVGRLDYFSEGLLLLTNDGDLAYCLTHPSRHIPKIYEVTIRGPMPESALNSFRSGLLLPDGKQLQPIGIDIKRLATGDTLARLELREGVNRQIRRMCDAFGLVILKLKRVAEGPLVLGQLEPGQFRRLEESELATLRNACGLVNVP